MPFLTKIIRNCQLRKKRKVGSLQVRRALLHGTCFSHNKNIRGKAVPPKRLPQYDLTDKRVSHNTSGKKGKGPGICARASMTLEAACVLPIFLFAVFNMYAAMNEIGLHVRMQTAMQQTGLSLAGYAYAYERVAQGSQVLRSELADVAFSEGYVKRQVEESVGTEYLQSVGVRGGADGVSFVQSDILTGDRITLVAAYRMGALFAPEEFLSFSMGNRVCLRAWTGYDNTVNAGGNAEAEQLVYVTEHGEVYHRSRACYHLHVTIRQTDQERLAAERNRDGGSYTACELCGSRRRTGVLYVSEDGSRYHTTAACGALKRTVRVIPLSQAGDRAPCSECGKGV